MTPFPKNFLWGAATASFQVEGGIENCDWAKAGREGRVPVCGKACDHYHRFREDFALAKRLGHTAHRFSIEWARIEPEEGKFDEKEIEHYREVLRALRAEGLEPYITIWHFWMPLWFSESGGFKRKDAPEVFARYAEYVVDRLGDLCTHFATINEPYSHVVNGYVRGTWPPFKQFPYVTAVSLPNGNATTQVPYKNWWGFLDFFTVANTLARAHVLAYTAIKAKHKDIDLGIVFQVFLWDADNRWYNKLFARFQTWNMTTRFMNKVAPFCDSIGVNHYFYRRFGSAPKRDVSDTGWEMYPEKIYDSLHLLNRYKKPMYVAEVGVADARDVFRADYIRSAVEGTNKALEEGCDVRAFLYWSLLDNYELALGFDKRFGLIAVDFDTQERAIRPSAWVYKEIIEGSGRIDSSPYASTLRRDSVGG